MALALNDKLARNENQLAEKIYKTSIPLSVWNGPLVRKEEWTNGRSDTQRVLTSERNLPDNIDEWEDISPNNETNNCALAADIVPRGNTERTFSLVQKAIESDRICVNDTRNAFNPTEQIANMFSNLSRVVAYTWKRRAQLEYTRLAEYKVIATHGLPFNDTAFPAIAPTTILTQKILNVWYQSLLQMGAAEDGGMLGKMDGKPQFILVTDMATSDEIMREDGNVNAFLWNDKRVKELLAPLGVDRSFRGFTHIVDVYPRRYTFNGGVWTEVDPWESQAATTGTKRKLSAAYLEAPYTDSVIYLPSVMCFQHPRPISTMGSGTSFDPKSYVGDFRWKNVENVDPSSAYYNPDKDWGFYRSKMISATKPIFPQYGVVIRHLRCPSDIGHQACGEGKAGASSLLGSGDSFFV